MVEAIRKHKILIIILGLLLIGALILLLLLISKLNVSKIPSRGVFVVNFPMQDDILAHLA